MAQVWTCTYFQERTHLETGACAFLCFFYYQILVLSVKAVDIKNEKGVLTMNYRQQKQILLKES
ncbi:MAG: hypothetical protein ABWY25_05490, partial [Paenisporosarcina sp.]